MKTKTFEIHTNLIKDSIADLLYGDRIVSKKNIISNINDALYRVISRGNTDLCPFPQLEADEVDWNKITLLYNKLYGKK